MEDGAVTHILLRTGVVLFVFFHKGNALNEIYLFIPILMMCTIFQDFFIMQSIR